MLKDISFLLKGCGGISLANGGVEFINGTDYSSVVKLKCSDGYQLNGTETVTCLESGYWDIISDCVIRGTSAVMYISRMKSFLKCFITVKSQINIENVTKGHVK